MIKPRIINISQFMFTALTLSSVLAMALEPGQATGAVVLNPVGDFTAELSQIKGVVKISADKKLSASNIVIDLKTLSTGMSLRDKHAKEKYLEIHKYPQAEIIKAYGENGQGTAILKFHGQQNEIKGAYKIIGKNVELEFKILLSQFGITDISHKGVGVEDEVKLKALLPLEAGSSKPTVPSKILPTKKSAPKK